MIRDCNGRRAFDTLRRYRGTTLAELWRSLRTLEALQADAAAQQAAEVAAQQEAAALPGEAKLKCRSNPKFAGFLANPQLRPHLCRHQYARRPPPNRRRPPWRALRQPQPVPRRTGSNPSAAQLLANRRCPCRARWSKARPVPRRTIVLLRQAVVRLLARTAD
jgi:hypothetical protein